MFVCLCGLLSEKGGEKLKPNRALLRKEPLMICSVSLSSSPYTSISICIYTICIYKYVLIYMCTFMHIYIYVHLCIYIYTHPSTHPPTNPPTPSPTYTHLIACVDISLGLHQHPCRLAVAVEGSVVQRSRLALYN